MGQRSGRSTRGPLAAAAHLESGVAMGGATVGTRARQARLAMVPVAMGLLLGTAACTPGTTRPTATPPTIMHASEHGSRIQALQAGEGFSCAVRGDGAVFCWGENGDGQAAPDLRDHDFIGAPRRVPRVDGAGGLWLGGAAACSLGRRATLRCWGDGFRDVEEIPVEGDVAQVLPERETLCVRGDGGLSCAPRRHDGGGQRLAFRFETMELPASGGIVALRPASWMYPGDQANLPGARTVSPFELCALDDGMVRCRDSRGRVTVVGEGVLAITGGKRLCLRDARGLACSRAHTDSLAEACRDDCEAMFVPIAAGEGALAFGAGADLGCAVAADAVLRCWKWTTRYEAEEVDMGYESWFEPRVAEDKIHPPQDLGVFARAQLVVGDDHACLLDAEGTLSCWGAARRGATGHGLAVARLETPHDVDSLLASGLAAGGAHTCAVTGRGVSCWGDNRHGQLGLDAVTHSAEAVALRLPSTQPVVQIAAGAAHTCLGFGDGSVGCFGANRGGQLGVSRDAGGPALRRVPGVSGAIDIDAYGDRTCVLDGGGGVRCWGRCYRSGPCDGPQVVRALAGGRQVVAGPEICVRTATALQCVASPSSRRVREVPLAATFASGACAVSTAGEVGCFAWQDSEILGAPPALGRFPVQGIAGATAIAQRHRRGCAVAGGGLACFETRSIGDGDGDYLPSIESDFQAVSVEGVGDAVEVVVGSDHTCFRRSAGTVACFGANTLGRLGRGEPVQFVGRPLPVPLPAAVEESHRGGADAPAGGRHPD